MHLAPPARSCSAEPGRLHRTGNLHEGCAGVGQGPEQGYPGGPRESPRRKPARTSSGSAWSARSRPTALRPLSRGRLRGWPHGHEKMQKMGERSTRRSLSLRPGGDTCSVAGEIKGFSMMSTAEPPAGAPPCERLFEIETPAVACGGKKLPSTEWGPVAYGARYHQRGARPAGAWAVASENLKVLICGKDKSSPQRTTRPSCASQVLPGRKVSRAARRPPSLRRRFHPYVHVEDGARYFHGGRPSYEESILSVRHQYTTVASTGCVPFRPIFQITAASHNHSKRPFGDNVWALAPP